MKTTYRIREAPFRAFRTVGGGVESVCLFYLSCSPDWARVYKDRQLGVELLTSFWWADAVEFA